MFARDIQERYAGRDLMIVSPDVGGVVRARAIATRLGCDLTIVDKRRERAGVSEVMHVIATWRPRLHSGRRHRRKRQHPGQRRPGADRPGAKSASVYVTHGVLSGTAVARITASPIEMLTITDSILATEAVQLATNIRQISIAHCWPTPWRASTTRNRSARCLTDAEGRTHVKLFYAQGAARSAFTCCWRRSQAV